LRYRLVADLGFTGGSANIGKSRAVGPELIHLIS
jgi:hypothetical protein